MDVLRWHTIDLRSITISYDGVYDRDTISLRSVYDRFTIDLRSTYDQRTIDYDQLTIDLRSPTRSPYDRTRSATINTIDLRSIYDGTPQKMPFSIKYCSWNDMRISHIGNSQCKFAGFLKETNGIFTIRHDRFTIKYDQLR